MADVVVAMTNHASGKAGVLKRDFVRALLKHLILEDVACGTNVLDRTNTRGRRAMVSMAGGAGGRAEIASNNQRVVMHAGAVFGELIRGNGIPLHVAGVRMAPRASLRDIERVDFRSGITGGPQTMNTVAINADSHFCVALREELAVNAGLVLAQLIGAQRRIVFAHECCIRMATSAKTGDVFAFDLSAKPRGFAHSIRVGFSGVAAVAARTSQALLRMDVTGKLRFRDLERRIERAVAIQASIRRLSPAPASEENRRHKQEQRS